jgi:hypothetical protein
MHKNFKFEVGDLVFYNPSYNNSYANGTKELGVVIAIIKDRTPLFLSFPEKDYFEFEYRVKWIKSGYVSTLLGFNLKKLEIPKKTP